MFRRCPPAVALSANGSTHMSATPLIPLAGCRISVLGESVQARLHRFLSLSPEDQERVGWLIDRLSDPREPALEPDATPVLEVLVDLRH